MPTIGQVLVVKNGDDFSVLSESRDDLLEHPQPGIAGLPLRVPRIVAQFPDDEHPLHRHPIGTQGDGLLDRFGQSRVEFLRMGLSQATGVKLVQVQGGYAQLGRRAAGPAVTIENLPDENVCMSGRVIGGSDGRDRLERLWVRGRLFLCRFGLRFDPQQLGECQPQPSDLQQLPTRDVRW